MKELAVHCIVSLFAACAHQREGWPMRLPGDSQAHRTCLDCGRRRPYPLFEPAANVFAPAAKLARRATDRKLAEAARYARAEDLTKGEVLAA